MAAFRNIVCVARLLAAFLPDASAAGRRNDPDVPPRDPRGYWRQMTLDDATSTSKCVGTFDTPVCAVETVVACFARSRWDLCNVALDEPGRYDPSRYSPSPNFTRELYRLVWTQRLTRAAIGDIPRDASDERPGDIRIDVLRRSCSKRNGSESCNTSDDNPNIFTLRKTSSRWVVIDWSVTDFRWPKTREGHRKRK